MEIIHIILGKANPARMNGVNKVVHQLATKQAKSGRNVSVWGITKDTNINYETRAFKTVLYPTCRNVFKIADTLVEDIKTNANNAVFHIHGGWVPTFWSVANTLKKYGAKYVFTPHGAYNTIAMRKNHFIKKMYFDLFEKQVLNHASVIHSIGQSEIDGLNQIYKTNKNHLQAYGYEYNQTPPNKDVPTKSLANTDTFIMGFVGRLDIHTKGLDLMVTAMASSVLSRPNMLLWVVGDSDQKNALQQLVISKGLEKNIILLGSKFSEEKEAIMGKMDVFVHASRNEGLPASILEAAAMGIPCIVTQATNLGEIIEKSDAGITVQNEDSTALSFAFNKMYDLWAEGKLGAKGINASHMVKNHFAWETILPQFDVMYAK